MPRGVRRHLLKPCFKQEHLFVRLAIRNTSNTSDTMNTMNTMNTITSTIVITIMACGKAAS